MNLFYQCTSLETINLPPGLTSIGGSCFSNCEALSSLIFPSSFVTLGNNAFLGSGITEIVFQSANNPNFIQILDNAFFGATKLSKIKLPEHVIHIGDKAFYQTAITEIILPKTVQRIDGFCFSSCPNLKSFTIPQGCALKYIGSSFLENCSSLSLIQSYIEEFPTENGALYNA